MAKKLQKGKTGTNSRFITRTRAVKKLQVKLADFRRLCILKGIYPREPKKKPSGSRKTYYHVKDINFLLHEPLLEKFREQHAYAKKIKRAKAKDQTQLYEALKARAPGYTLDHLVKERYPSFIDALRDLDDALTLTSLFATLPAEGQYKIPPERVATAKRLCTEFQAYVVCARALTKSFVSVKGIYYQAEILGQSITWLTPHLLSQQLPPDVDYRVMLTFLEFYETLLRFVNFKLYHMIGLSYPPHEMFTDPCGLGLPALMDTSTKENLQAAIDSVSIAEEAEKEDEEDEEEQDEEVDEEDEEADEGHDEMDKDVDGISNGADGRKEHTTADDENTKKRADLSQLFENCVFFLQREVPRESLIFVIKSFGGVVAWDGAATSGIAYEENDERITHHIVDRPVQGHRFFSREYIQPQWVYDSINNGILVPVEEYAPGNHPPPHLSPFVTYGEEDYVPEYAQTLERLRVAAHGDAKTTEEVDVDMTGELDEEQKEAAAKKEAEAQEKQYRAELAKESAGVPYSVAREGGNDNAEDEEEGAQATEKDASKTKLEDSQMAKVMMTRKNRKLYDAINTRIEKKKAAAQRLREKAEASKAK